MDKKYKIFDSVIFEYDLDLIKFRFEEISHLVDYIIILESKVDLEGNEKKLLFKENFSFFKKWEDKIILVEWSPKDTDTSLKERMISCYDYLKETLLSNCKNFEDIIFLSKSNELPNYNNIDDIISELTYGPVYLSPTNFVWNIDYISNKISFGCTCIKFTNLIQNKNFYHEVYINSVNSFNEFITDTIIPVDLIKNGWKFTKFTSNNNSNDLFLKENLLPYENISPITTYMLELRDDTIELPVNYKLLPYNKIGRDYVKKHLFIVDCNTDHPFEFWEKEYDTISIIDFSNDFKEIFVNPITNKTTRSLLFVPNKALYGDESLEEFQENYKKNEIKKIIHTIFPQDQDNIRIIYKNNDIDGLWLNLKNEILSEIINPS